MEAKWRLHAPEAFYSDVVESAPADDKPISDEEQPSPLVRVQPPKELHNRLPK